MVSGQESIIPYPDVTPYAHGDGTKDSVRDIWVRCLKQAERDLTTVIEGTENEFLLIGANLRDFHARALTISDISSAINNLLSGDDILRAIGGLKEVLQRITTYQELFTESIKMRIEQLDKILKSIQRISDPLSEFRDITKTLRTLCTTTKIQSAIIGHSARGFSILADDVKGLSNVIDERADDITKDLKTLETLVVQTHAKLQIFAVRQKNNVQVILTNTDAALSSLTQKYHLSRTAAEQVLSRATGITVSVGEIVTSLQFHDITRQRFEQIRKAVSGICERIEHGMHAPILPTAKTILTGRMHQEQGNMLITGLSVTTKEFSSAVHNIVSNLISIWKNINEVLKEAHAITRDTESGHGTVITQVEYCLSAVTSAILTLSESAEADRELSGAIRSLSGTTGEISRFIQDIRQIGESLTLISWNSNIKAEGIGKAGASLNVVADYIKKLADDSHAKAFDVSEALEGVTNAIHELSVRVADGTIIDESDITGMKEHLDDMTGIFKSVNEKIQSFLDEIETKGGDLSADIEKVAKNIDVHNSVRKVVREILSQIDIIPYDTSSSHDSGLLASLFTDEFPSEKNYDSDAGTRDKTPDTGIELF